MNQESHHDSHNDLVARIARLSRPLKPQATGLHPRLPQLESIRAVVFDIYGTLVISASGDIGLGGEHGEAEAFSAALDATGLQAPGADAMLSGPAQVKRIIGEHHQARRAEGIEYPEVDIVAVWEEVLTHLRIGASREAVERLAVEYECRVNPVWPMPGLAEVLKTLRGRGLRMGIVSNAQFYTPLMFRALLAGPFALGFTPEYCTWSYRQLEAKPSVRLYRQTLEMLVEREGITASQVLYVGNDQLKDIWPAASVGCRTALFAGDRRSLRLREDDVRCNGTQPDAVVTDLRQIAGMLA